MKINWKQKLASRKFWALLASLTVSVLSATGTITDNQVAQVVGIIGAVGACMVYMLAESAVDAAQKGERDE